MTSILTYRPQYEYKRKLTAVLRDADASAGNLLGHGSEAGQSQKLPSEKLIADGEQKGYQPSEALLDYIDVTPTDVLQGYLSAKRELGELKKDLVEKLRDLVTEGPSIEEYIKAKGPGANKDLDVVYEFEDLHTETVDGRTEAEVLPVIEDFLNELDSLTPFIEREIGPIGRIEESEELEVDGELINPELEIVREEEQADIAHMIELDKSRRLDLERAHERNHILGFLDKRFQGIRHTVEQVGSLITDNEDDAYGGSGREIADTLTQMPGLREQFERTNMERFERHVRATVDAHSRMRRLVTREYKRQLLDEVVRLQHDKLEARNYIRQIEQVNPERDADAFNLFLLDTLESIDEIRSKSDHLVEDLYRISELERIQNMDYTEALRRKNETRQTHRIITKGGTPAWREGDVEMGVLPPLR